MRVMGPVMAAWLASVLTASAGATDGAWALALVGAGWSLPLFAALAGFALLRLRRQQARPPGAEFGA